MSHAHHHERQPSEAHEHHQHHEPHPDREQHAAASLNRLATSATNHCLTGCVIGEVLGMTIATALGWSDVASIALAVGLAFLFGYSLTSVPLIRASLPLATVVPIALAADTVSITIMEVIDNLAMILVPGAMDAGLTDARFWLPLLGGFVVAWPFAFAVNRAMIRRGKGHAVVHEYH
ncbi:MAG: DUF4396 domain-containing protein [Actinobacteria bacterium]|nr:DUF4396 domain-containing protein [Actinomycetota bacterium]